MVWQEPYIATMPDWRKIEEIEIMKIYRLIWFGKPVQRNHTRQKGKSLRYKVWYGGLFCSFARVIAQYNSILKGVLWYCKYSQRHCARMKYIAMKIHWQIIGILLKSKHSDDEDWNEDYEKKVEQADKILGNISASNIRSQIGLRVQNIKAVLVLSWLFCRLWNIIFLSNKVFHLKTFPKSVVK